ncbi:protein SPMIP2 [Tenrec ecaudatus]|uniref:protein SPMIP2 n=1 Tax=Tenrec ecaudatus TaxID=94439 RepID=UPI003F599108
MGPYQGGPDYIRDYQPKIHQHATYIGEARPVAEKTGNLSYLWRAAPHRSLPPKYKYNYVGEIGWGIPEYDCINKSNLESGFHIKQGEFSQAGDDKLSHRYQNPWQPKPYLLDMQGKYSRGSLAWHLGDYENTNKRNSKRAVLLRQSKASSARAAMPPVLPQLPPKEQVKAFAFGITTGKNERELENILVVE